MKESNTNRAQREEERENRKGVLLREREEERLESQEVRELPVKEEQAYSLMNAS